MAIREDAREARRSAEPGSRRVRATILLVEDDADSREVIRLILELEGHGVAVAEDGSRGAQMARTLRPDIAFVDINLPGLDGYAVARAVRGELRDAIWLVALTALARPEDRRRSIAAGFDLHLTKPVQPREITALVRAIVSDRNL